MCRRAVVDVACGKPNVRYSPNHDALLDYVDSLANACPCTFVRSKLLLSEFISSTAKPRLGRIRCQAVGRHDGRRHYIRSHLESFANKNVADSNIIFNMALRRFISECKAQKKPARLKYIAY
jgi:hypothetical protein